MKHLSIILVIVWIMVIAACTSEPGSDISIEDAWVRAASTQTMEVDQATSQSDMSGGGETEHMDSFNSAAYMVIQNNGSTPDRLVRASSDAALSTELHLSEVKDGVMSMRPVEGVDIPARGKAELKPGSYHIMLVGITRDLTAGEKLKLTLEFENAGEMEVEAVVRAP